MLRFIHTADWQIGMKAAHVGAVAQRVRDARLKAARRVVEAATRHDVDFMAITGDVFEDNAVDRVLVQKVADILGDFAGPVYITPGNHDPLVPGSVWDHTAWQSHANVHVLRKAEPLETGRGVLYPCPLQEKYSRKDPTRWIEAKNTPQIAIGLAHGTVEGVAQDTLDYPIARDAADRTGLDYLAIGHWHSAATFPSADAAVRLAYSGTPETTRFGERDSGNVLLVEIADRGAPPRLTPIHTGGLTWKTLAGEIRQRDDVRRMREEVESLSSPGTTLLDMRLSGVLHPGQQDELTRIQEILQARFLYGRIDHSHLHPAPEDDSWLAALPIGVMREVARQLKLLSDPAAHTERPGYATPEVAACALLELYRMTAEAQE